VGVAGEAPGDRAAAPGHGLLVRGVVKSSQGTHIPYATLDVWQVRTEREREREQNKCL
jgi:protocatechuate 3,4-dioxygenase beta subunit